MSQRLALVIGNGTYQDTMLARLVTPDADVRRLADVLQAPEIGGFEVSLLVDQPEAAVRRAIARFFADRRQDDVLVLYFSGHGVLDDQGHLYLAVQDTDHTLLRATAIPAALITQEMDRSRSRRQVLILDCCHGGAFARGAKGAPGMSVGTAAAFEGHGYGKVVLTATDATQYAWEGDEVLGQAETSVFTHYLIQGLRTGEADANADGRITLDELYDYIYGQMVRTTPRQTPGKWSYKQQGDLIIANNPRAALRPAALPPELQSAVESPFSAVREGAVHELDRLLRGTNASLALAARAALEHLKDDDSRRVSTAAAERLATSVEPQGLGEDQTAVDTTAAKSIPATAPGKNLEEEPAWDVITQGKRPHQWRKRYVIGSLVGAGGLIAVMIAWFTHSSLFSSFLIPPASVPSIVKTPSEPLARQGSGSIRDERFGMTVQELTPEIARDLGISETTGVVVRDVESGSPADEAGVRHSDIILEISQSKFFSKISNLQDYRAGFNRVKEADPVLLLIRRGRNVLYTALKAPEPSQN